MKNNSKVKSQKSKVKRGELCGKCQLRIGISCVCGLELVKSGNDSRVNLLPIDRIPKRYRYDPQTDRRYEFRSEMRTHVREHNARLGPRDCKISLE